jgi:hypothetical protein
MKITKRKFKEAAMTLVCSHCQNVPAISGNYCSDHCRRKAHRHRFRILLTSAASVLVLIFGVYITPSSEQRPKSLSISDAENFARVGSLPICEAIGKTDSHTCLGGKTSSKAVSVKGNPGDVKNWIVCMACQGTDKLRGVLPIPASQD